METKLERTDQICNGQTTKERGTIGKLTEASQLLKNMEKLFGGMIQVESYILKYLNKEGVRYEIGI